jgi:hydroxymethylglutaryl-CoA reductase (NADPH)
VAQVPLGFAGPIKVNGEHAKGEFVVPLCTSEGTLVASYNRGIKILNMCGGVSVTVVDDRMQRAPVFVFDSAREARDFASWLDDNMDEIRRQAESSSRLPN